MRKTACSRRSLPASTFASSQAGSALLGPARADAFKTGLPVSNGIGEEGWSRIGRDRLKRGERDASAGAAPKKVRGMLPADYGRGAVRIVSTIKNGSMQQGKIVSGEIRTGVQ